MPTWSKLRILGTRTELLEKRVLGSNCKILFFSLKLIFSDDNLEGKNEALHGQLWINKIKNQQLFLEAVIRSSRVISSSMGQWIQVALHVNVCL